VKGVPVGCVRYSEFDFIAMLWWGGGCIPSIGGVVAVFFFFSFCVVLSS